MPTKKEKLDYAQRNPNRNETRFVRYKPSKLHNKFKDKIAATETNHTTPKILFKALVGVAPLTKFKPTEMMFHKVAKFGGEYNTKGLAIPVNVDINVSDKMVNPPIELVKEAIKHSKYRSIMNSCICREMDDCKDYPKDLGCMFLGKAGMACVEYGTGHEATVEECLEHVDKAIAAGLSVGTYWLELEQYCWGWKDEDMPDVIAFCFCCPCCCHAIKYQNLAGGELKHLLHQSIGWQCEPIDWKCIQCGNCVKHCPRGYLKMEKGKIVVDDHCAGCGLCIKHCGHGALHVIQKGETKPHLQDYFAKLDAEW